MRTKWLQGDGRGRLRAAGLHPGPEKDFSIDNLLVRVYFIIMMIRWTGLAPWEFEGHPPLLPKLTEVPFALTRSPRSTFVSVGSALCFCFVSLEQQVE